VFKLGIVRTERARAAAHQAGGEEVREPSFCCAICVAAAREDAAHYNGILRLLQMANGHLEGDIPRVASPGSTANPSRVITASHHPGSRLSVTDLAVASGNHERRLRPGAPVRV